jgi:hypothetical protein
MAKRKTKTDKIEETLDQEILQEAPDAAATTSAPEASEAAAISAAPEAKSQEQRLIFFGRDFLETRFPQALKAIDDIAIDWKAEGEFAALPIPNPTAKALVQEGLQRARKLERELQDFRSEARKTFDVKVAPAAQRVLGNVKGLYSNISRLRH